MFKVGDLIDSKYIVDRVCPTPGGMGIVLFVSDNITGQDLVLKYCAETDDEMIARFRREVRLLTKCKGSDFVVPLVDLNLKHDPPYFVMECADSDLSAAIPNLKDDHEEQERVFLRMVDCVEYIHSNGDRHRDIKPPNFLVFDDRVVISDLGLGKDPSSDTVFTQSVDARGTPAFSPPQFFEHGGFKDAHDSDDIYMLGKSFYYLLTGANPQVLVKKKVNAVLYHVIEKCCAEAREDRFQSCEELRAALVSAFDLLLKRKDSSVRFEELRTKLVNIGSGGPTGTRDEFIEFFELLPNEDPDIQIGAVENFPFAAVAWFAQLNLPDRSLDVFFEAYRKFFDEIFSRKFYPFSHAEFTASHMKCIFESKAKTGAKVKAFGLALEITNRYNRSAGLEICAEMVQSIRAGEDDLAFAICQLIEKRHPTYLESVVDLGKCSHFHVIKTIKALKSKED